MCDNFPVIESKYYWRFNLSLSLHCGRGETVGEVVGEEDLWGKVVGGRQWTARGLVQGSSSFILAHPPTSFTLPPASLPLASLPLPLFLMLLCSFCPPAASGRLSPPCSLFHLPPLTLGHLQQVLALLQPVAWIMAPA